MAAALAYTNKVTLHIPRLSNSFIGMGQDLEDVDLTATTMKSLAKWVIAVEA